MLQQLFAAVVSALPRLLPPWRSCCRVVSAVLLTHAVINNLHAVCRYRDQRDRPDLSNPESMQLYLETRFEQLKVKHLHTLFACSA